MTVQLEWGLQPPEGYEGPAWGARAIYSLRFTGRSVIDLLWDRQCGVGGDALKALCEMLDTTGLDQLRERCTAEHLRGDEHRTLRVEVGDYVIEANPRESCGYLYIVAYRRPCLACKRGVPESRVYAGATGPFCDVTCREAYLSRPTVSATDVLESYIPPTNEQLRSAVKQQDFRYPPKSIPFEPATRVPGTLSGYRCSVPMCGESGVCAECRKRGAH